MSEQDPGGGRDQTVVESVPGKSDGVVGKGERQAQIPGSRVEAVAE
jgi:hypothetical protein